MLSFSNSISTSLYQLRYKFTWLSPKSQISRRRRQSFTFLAKKKIFKDFVNSQQEWKVRRLRVWKISIYLNFLSEAWTAKSRNTIIIMINIDKERRRRQEAMRKQKKSEHKFHQQKILSISRFSSRSPSTTTWTQVLYTLYSANKNGFPLG